MVEEYPDSSFYPEAQYGLAVVLEEQGQLRSALTLLQELQGNYPAPAVLRNRIEQIQQRMKKKRKAT